MDSVAVSSEMPDEYRSDFLILLSLWPGDASGGYSDIRPHQLSHGASHEHCCFAADHRTIDIEQPVLHLGGIGHDPALEPFSAPGCLDQS